MYYGLHSKTKEPISSQIGKPLEISLWTLVRELFRKPMALLNNSKIFELNSLKNTVKSMVLPYWEKQILKKKLCLQNKPNQIKSDRLNFAD